MLDYKAPEENPVVLDQLEKRAHRGKLGVWEAKANKDHRVYPDQLVQLVLKVYQDRLE